MLICCPLRMVRACMLGMWLVATSAGAQSSERAEQPPVHVTAMVVRGRHDREYERCRVRVRVLARDGEVGPSVGEELEASVSCYTFMLHQLRRRGRAFHMRISPRHGTPAHEVEIVGAEIFGGPR